MTLFLDTAILINLERKDKEVIKKIETLIETDPAPANIGLINYLVRQKESLAPESPLSLRKFFQEIVKIPF